jgi:hypothetical protein
MRQAGKKSPGRHRCDERSTSLQRDDSDGPDAVSERIDKRCPGIKGHEPASNVTVDIAREKTNRPVGGVMHVPIHPDATIRCADAVQTINFDKPVRRQLPVLPHRLVLKTTDSHGARAGQIEGHFTRVLTQDCSSMFSWVRRIAVESRCKGKGIRSIGRGPDK